MADIQSTLSFLSILRHRVLLNGAVAMGSPVRIQRAFLPVLGRPVAGAGWIAKGHPSIDSHHRTGLVMVNGVAQISRRYAIDWRITKQGASFAGDPLDVRAYHAYGQNVLAVEQGIVVGARDGLPDNIPRTPAGFTPALLLALDNLAGNDVVVDHGKGQFAFYAPLQPGSVRVKKGERVRRGQLIGQIGNSGDARDPHLHFQLTTGPDILASEGLPYVHDRYRVLAADGRWEIRTAELPLTTMSIDFGTGDQPR